MGEEITPFSSSNYVPPRKHYATLNPDIIDALMRHEWKCATCGNRPTVNIRQDEQKANTFIVFHCHGLDDIHHLQVEAHKWRELFRIVPFRPIILTKPKQLPKTPYGGLADETHKYLDVESDTKRLPGS